MRFLHTADWHLGRLFYGTSLIEEQSRLLDQLVDLASERKIQAFLIAGDLYDRSVPPADAVRLFDSFLTRMADAHIPVIAIAGNHDSADRVGFGAQLMRDRGVHLCGRLELVEAPENHTVTLEDEHGPLQIYSIPFAEPAWVRQHLNREDLRSYEASMAALLDQLRDQHPANTRSILLAHAFVGGSSEEVEESESERPLSVGGTDFIDASVFQGFDYVALGHLHRPQQAGSERVHYSGSLYPYSFSEAEHAKSVQIVEMDAQGQCQIEKVQLHPQRTLRIVEGLLEEILEDAAQHLGASGHDDYLLVRLLDEGALLHPLARLREFYPNVMQLERPVLEAQLHEGSGGSSPQLKRTAAELFDDFFHEVSGEHLNPPQRQAYADAIEAMNRREGEGNVEPEGLK
jgi:exonuclease SbcD